MPRIMAIGGLSDCGCAGSGTGRTKPLRAGRHGGGSVGAVVLEGKPRGTSGLSGARGKRTRVCITRADGTKHCFLRKKKRRSRRR